MMRRYELSDEEWVRIEPLTVGKASDCGVTAKDNRQFVNAVLWIARTGAPWRDLPERYGNWNSVYQRFNRWAKAGIWERIFLTLQATDDEWLMLDSTIIRAHQQAAGQKK
jgi:transposase